MTEDRTPQRESMHIDPYERNWIRISVVVLVLFAVAVAISGFGLGFEVTHGHERVDPATVTEAGPFAEPGLRQVAPGVYDAYVVAQTFLFTPREMTVPAGSEVTFHVTSIDVQHGLLLEGTNLNMQVVPGRVSSLTITLDEPGRYDYICTEYCGSAHAQMFGTLIVEE